jgi:ATP synthase protein I
VTVSLPVQKTAAASAFTSGEPQRLALRIALTQLAVTVFIAAVCAPVWGARQGASALAGGMIGIVGNLPMAVALLRTDGSPQKVLTRMILGQLTKVGLTVALLFVAARMPWLKWLPLLVAYAATFLVFWWVPTAASRRAVKARG